MAVSLRALVSALEDDPYCGTRPPHWPGGPLRLGDLQEIISVLIAWLLRHGPPPPEPWWLKEISQSVAQLTLAARMEGQLGGAIQHAALGALREQLGALRAAQKQQER